MDLQVYLVLVQNAPELAVPSVRVCLVDNRACGSFVARCTRIDSCIVFLLADSHQKLGSLFARRTCGAADTWVRQTLVKSQTGISYLILHRTVEGCKMDFIIQLRMM
jgi:hypothetical protein